MSVEQSAVVSLLSRVLNELYSVKDSDDFFAHALGVLRQCLSVRVATCSRILVKERRSGLLTVSLGDSEADEQWLLQRARRWDVKNPFLGHCFTNAVGAVLRIADIMPQEQWLASDYACHVLGGVRGEHGTSVRFYDGGHCYCFCFYDSAPLDMQTCRLLEMVAVHLERAYQWHRSLREVSQLGAYRNMIVLDAEGRMLQASEEALQLLRHYFPIADSIAARQLPAAVVDWVDSVLRKHSDVDVFEVSCLRQNREGKAIVVLLAPSLARRFNLIVEEQAEVRFATRLIELGLSEREIDVLKWVCEGKQNKEIAVILGISVKTVSRHLESIFQKLGCENRHAAMRMAWDTVGATEAAIAVAGERQNLGRVVSAF